MKKPILTMLRDKTSSLEEFRRAADRIGTLLSFETAEILEKETLGIQTPLGPAMGERLKHPITLISILRAGMVMLPPFLKLFPSSKVGFVGLRRDEETALPTLYYKNLPNIAKEETVIILDPMIATGGSGNLVLEMLKSQNIADEKIVYVGIIAAPEGLSTLKKAAPHMKILCAEVDERLNDKKFIVPGLGDFGDRYFGT